MIYDLSSVLIKSRADGEPVSAEIPYTLYKQFLELAEAARAFEVERQTRATPRGAYRSSLSSVVQSTSEKLPDQKVDSDNPFGETSRVKTTHRNRHPYLHAASNKSSPKRDQLEKLFAAPIAPAEQTIADGALAFELEKLPQPDEQPTPELPREVVRLLSQGFTPLAAWRRYRGLTPQEAAAGYGCKPGTIYLYESRGRISNKILAKFAEVYDCALGQLLRIDAPAVSSGATHASSNESVQRVAS